MAMTKRDLVDDVRALHPTLTKKLITALVNDVFDSMAAGLKTGKRVQIPALGTFVVRQRAPRNGRHPITCVPITVPGGKRVSFRASKRLKSLVDR